MNIIYDRSETIRESYHDVQFTMVLTLGLVVMVIFLFLRNFSATIIPSLALPFSIIGTFAIMYLLGYSLDNLSMMALILSIGFVVDDAIVMLENIVRHMEMGESAMTAALKGSREIGFTIVSMTLSLAAVFIPVLFMGGVLGRLFEEFAVTICVAILISGVVSVTLTPMLCSRFLRPPSQQKHGAFYNATERFFDRMLHVYEVTLSWVLQHRAPTVAVFVLTLVATVWMFIIIPKGFIPDQDTDQMVVVTEAAQGTSYFKMVEHQKEVAELLRQDPNIESLVSNVGGTASTTLGGPNFGQMVVHLKPRSERKMLVNEIIDDLRVKLADFPGMRVFLQNPPTVQLGGQVTKSPYQFSLYAPDKKELYAFAAKLEKEVAQVPGLIDVTSDLQISSPQVNVQIDRDRAAAVHVSAQQIENALYDAYGPRWVSTIYAAVNEYKVLLELKPEYQKDPKALSLLYFKSTEGRLVPLDSVAHLSQGTGPQTINHFGQLPAVTISFNVQTGVSLGNVVDQIQDIIKRELPPTFSTAFQGAAKAFQSSLVEPVGLAHRRHCRRLHRAGHSVRKLCAPAHHSVRAALGRLWCAGHSLPVRDGLEYLRLCRLDYVGGNRREERHHANRFCAGRRAQQWHGSHGSHLPRLPHPLSAHHDDYDGGFVGCRSDRARLRRWRRSPAAAGIGRGGRSPVLPACHALPHSCRVHLSGCRR